MELDNDPQDSDKSRKKQLSEQRSVLAKQRTLLAKQRTFSAWVRTGLATFTVGLGIAQLLGEQEPRILIEFAGGALVVIGMAILGIGLWSYRRTFRVLREREIESVPVWAITGITIAMILIALVLLVIIMI